MVKSLKKRDVILLLIFLFYNWTPYFIHEYSSPYFVWLNAFFVISLFIYLFTRFIVNILLFAYALFSYIVNEIHLYTFIIYIILLVIHCLYMNTVIMDYFGMW